MLFIIILLCLILPVTANADEGAAGYLDSGVGAKSSSMGNAYVSIADDPSAVYWNAAGLPQIRMHKITLMSSVSGIGRRYNYAGYVFPFQFKKKDRFLSWEKKEPAKAGIGIGWINYGIKDIQGRDTYGNPTEKFSDSENAFMLAYGQTTGDNLSFGGGFKYLVHDLTDYGSACGMGFDIGILYRLGETASAGLNVQNIFSSLKWSIRDPVLQKKFVYKEKVFMNYKAGVSIKLFKNKLLLSSDIDKTDKQSLRFHAGCDYKICENISVRAGCDNLKITAGFGWNKKSISLDYTFIYERYGWDMVHRFSLNKSFGEEQKRKKKTKIKKRKKFKLKF